MTRFIALAKVGNANKKKVRVFENYVDKRGPDSLPVQFAQESEKTGLM